MSDPPTQGLSFQGRTPWRITKEVISKISGLAALGLTHEQIALSMGIAVSTLYYKKKNNAELLEAIERGRAAGVVTVASALFNNATKPTKGMPHGNVAAQTFYLKSRGGWRDEQAGDGEQVDEIIFRRRRPAGQET